MPVVICTPAGATDNSYVSEADAAEFFSARLDYPKWLAHTVEDRQRALIQATSDIEALGGHKDAVTADRARFKGAPGTTTQALFFPRTTDYGTTGAIIPVDVVRAVCLQAMYLLDIKSLPDVVNRSRLRSQGVRSFSIEGLSETLGGTDCPEGLCSAAWAIMRQYVRVGYPTE